ncbi:hypothetical protein ACNKXS_03310 [Christiangramia marina]|uniref:hypothetical protein n=1 Tax=Christiangramia marina TaxID=409436 RepID=UPI003AA878D8
MEKLFELLFTAIATVLATVVVITIVKRILLIRIFRSQCELALLEAIVKEKSIPKNAKKFWLDLYKSKKPSFLQLFFSTKTYEITSWFTSEEIDGFFIPSSEFNSIKK